MLASGFIVLKVANETGEHLICGDVRKGTEAGQFFPDHQEKYLAYKELNSDGSDAESSQHSDEKRAAQKNTRERGQDGKIFLLVDSNKFFGIWNSYLLFSGTTSSRPSTA